MQASGKNKCLIQQEAAIKFLSVKPNGAEWTQLAMLDQWDLKNSFTQQTPVEHMYLGTWSVRTSGEPADKHCLQSIWDEAQFSASSSAVIEISQNE